MQGKGKSKIMEILENGMISLAIGNYTFEKVNTIECFKLNLNQSNHWRNTEVNSRIKNTEAYHVPY